MKPTMSKLLELMSRRYFYRIVLSLCILCTLHFNINEGELVRVFVCIHFTCRASYMMVGEECKHNNRPSQSLSIPMIVDAPFPGQQMHSLGSLSNLLCDLLCDSLFYWVFPLLSQCYVLVNVLHTGRDTIIHRQVLIY